MFELWVRSRITDVGLWDHLKVRLFSLTFPF